MEARNIGSCERGSLRTVMVQNSDTQPHPYDPYLVPLSLGHKYRVILSYYRGFHGL
jgi:hypothetical protein